MVDLIKDDTGCVQGARVRDTTSGETWTVNAKAVVNATGCYADTIRKMDDPSVDPMILMARGTHIVLVIYLLLVQCSSVLSSCIQTD